MYNNCRKNNQGVHLTKALILLGIVTDDERS